MGLLPEIHVAYIAMNNQLYLWDYATGSVRVAFFIGWLDGRLCLQFIDVVT